MGIKKRARNLPEKETEMELKLWEHDIPYLTEGTETPNTLHTYLIPTDKPLPCVIVFAGGGYHVRAPHEAEPYAQCFNSYGIQAVTVDYRVSPNRFPAGLADAQRAVKLVRSHAAEWGIDPNRVVVCGSSAGGHLAASALLYDDVTMPAGHTPDATDAESARPNGAILCYPVISVRPEFGHAGSGMELLGKERYEAEHGAFDLQHKVTDATPPVFLWHTSDDSCVNVKNSLVFCESLRDHGVPFELHIYPHGPHGLGLAQDREDIRAWSGLAADWVLRNI